MPASASSVAVIRLSTVEEMQKHAWPLFEKEQDECIPLGDRSRRQIKPHWLRYRAMEQMDVLLILGAWVGETLIGYSWFVISPMMHHADVVVAMMDTFFVDPDHRRDTIGGELLGKVLRAETRAFAKRHGASEVIWNAPPDGTLDTILSRSDSAHLCFHVYSEVI